jgi:hypothetical protein
LPSDRIRRWILGLLTLGQAGLVAELLLLGHYEDPLQWIPLALIGLGLLTAVLVGVSAGPASLRAFQVLMALFIVAGFIGTGLHFNANIEFQTEVDPSIKGSALLIKALRAKTPPALAPGAMIQLGLLGLVFTYQHPGFSRRRI